jgi:hypothetical protein
VIPLDLARSLRTAGLTWSPASGDRFVIDMPELREQSFVLSDLTVDLQHLGGEAVLAFNGTVEWALDSVTVEQAVWLPHEEQLRTALGPAFQRLESVDPQGFRVVLQIDGGAIEFADDDPATAYGRALLHVLTR